MNEERPIEKLLRRYAQKRRDEVGPPPELHPATRRLLQGEVARQFPKARPASRAGFWTILRARWVYVAAGVSVVLVGAMLLLPPGYQQKQASPLAQKVQEISLASAPTLSDEKISEETLKRAALEKKESPAILPAPVAAPAVASDTATAPRPEATTQLSLEDGAVRRLQEPQPVALSPTAQPADRHKSVRETPAATAAPTELDRLNTAQPAPTTLASAPVQRKAALPGLAGASTDPVAGKDFVVTDNRPAATTARAPANVTSDARNRKTTPARGGGLEREDQATISQSFANLAFVPAEDQKQKAAPPSPVLVNFRIEQHGDQWRVIDGDGSTYVGASTPAAASTGKVAAKDMDASAAESVRYGIRANNQPAAKYFHRVAGTNRTLQQPVAFEWNFIAVTNAAGVKTQTIGGAVQTMPVAPWVNSAVNGQVQINTRTQFELNAAPVTR